jgi:hypothetical protein
MWVILRLPARLVTATFGSLAAGARIIRASSDGSNDFAGRVPAFAATAVKA